MGAKAKVMVGVAEIILGVGSEATVVGYTIDGVTMTVSSSFADIKVEENEGTVIRRLVDQDVKIALNMAEGGLESLAAAIPGSDLAVDTLTIGTGELQVDRITLKGEAPSGYSRVIILDNVNPTGEVGIPFKKGEISIVPVTFSALVADDRTFGDAIDGVVAAPTLMVGASTKSSADGTKIEAKFSAEMASPVGKHAEFWFNEESIGTRQFSAAALADGDATIIELTVSGAAITAGKTLALYYQVGSVTSAALGILNSFSAQTVVARP